jgi:hypothetical protein
VPSTSYLGCFGTESTHSFLFFSLLGLLFLNLLEVLDYPTLNLFVASRVLPKFVRENDL